jgi:alpha-glucosidase (family GH31 glycosyl hydrolase)
MDIWHTCEPDKVGTEGWAGLEHRPWKFDATNQTLDIYRKFVDVHYQLVPYLLTTGSHAMDTNTSSITPLAKHNSFIEKLIDDFKPSTYNYLLGEDILVAPIISNSSAVDVTFPSGSNWVYWWNHSLVYTGGSKYTFNNIPLTEFSVFFKKGSFIPLRVTEGTPELGKAGLMGYIRWLLHIPPFSHTIYSTKIREEEKGGMIATFW